MKTKTLFCTALVALIVLCCGSDSQAQKKSTGKRKTPAKTTTTKKTPPPALSMDELIDMTYSVYQKFNNDNMYMYSSLEFESSKIVNIDFGYTVLEGNWSISGNKLTIVSGGLTYSLTSNDGGITFTGTCTNPKGTYPIKMYSNACRNLTDISNSKSWLNALKKGEYDDVWARYYVKSGDMCFADPVKVKFVEDENNPDEGTVKISGDGTFMELLGSFKSVYNFGEEGLTVHFKDSTPVKASTWAYSDNCGGCFCVQLGTKTLPGKGKTVIILDFFHK